MIFMILSCFYIHWRVIFPLQGIPRNISSCWRWSPAGKLHRDNQEDQGNEWSSSLPRNICKNWRKSGDIGCCNSRANHVDKLQNVSYMSQRYGFKQFYLYRTCLVLALKCCTVQLSLPMLRFTLVRWHSCCLTVGVTETVTWQWPSPRVTLSTNTPTSSSRPPVARWSSVRSVEASAENQVTRSNCLWINCWTIPGGKFWEIFWCPSGANIVMECLLRLECLGVLCTPTIIIIMATCIPLDPATRSSRGPGDMTTTRWAVTPLRHVTRVTTTWRDQTLGSRAL